MDYWSEESILSLIGFARNTLNWDREKRSDPPVQYLNHAMNRTSGQSQVKTEPIIQYFFKSSITADLCDLFFNFVEHVFSVLPEIYIEGTLYSSTPTRWSQNDIPNKNVRHSL
jgi:hypothetical protein